MSLSDELKQMEEARRRKAAVVRIEVREDPASNKPPPLVSEATGFEAVLMAKRRESAKFEAQFDARCRERPVKCPRHPEELMALDREESIRASFATRNDEGEWKLVVKLKPCSVCEALGQEAEQRVVMERLGVPGDLLHASLANWEARSDEERKVLATVREYARRPRGFLILLSPKFGNGKSHLAVAVLRAHGSGMFVTQAGFVARMRAEYGKAPRTIEAMKTTPLLVFDEIGLSSGGRDELPAIHEILNRRYADRTPTVLTGNQAKADELKEIVGPRVYDRMTEAVFACITLTGDSKRKARRESYLDSLA